MGGSFIKKTDVYVSGRDETVHLGVVLLTEDGKRWAAGEFGLCRRLAELRCESAPASILLRATRLC